LPPPSWILGFIISHKCEITKRGCKRVPSRHCEAAQAARKSLLAVVHPSAGASQVRRASFFGPSCRLNSASLAKGWLPPSFLGKSLKTQNPGESSAHEGRPRTHSPQEGLKGVQGAQAPWQGVWGMCPQNKKRGRVAHISKPAYEWDPRRWQILN